MRRGAWWLLELSAFFTVASIAWVVLRGSPGVPRRFAHRYGALVLAAVLFVISDRCGCQAPGTSAAQSSNQTDGCARIARTMCPVSRRRASIWSAAASRTSRRTGRFGRRSARDVGTIRTRATPIRRIQQSEQVEPIGRSRPDRVSWWAARQTRRCQLLCAPRRPCALLRRSPMRSSARSAHALSGWQSLQGAQES